MPLPKKNEYGVICTISTPYQPGHGEPEVKHAVDNNGTHICMRLEASQWEAIDKLGNLYGLQEKPTVLQKVRAMEKLAMCFNDMEAFEVVLPFTDVSAKKWRQSQAGHQMKLPKFNLTAGGVSSETQQTIRNGYMIWWFQKKDNGLKFVEWGTINGHWKKWRHLARNFWFLLCPKVTPETAYARFVNWIKGQQIKTFTQFDGLFDDLIDLAKDARKREAIKDLKKEVVRHPEFNSQTMFPLDQETEAMKLLAEYLEEEGYNVEPAGTLNVLPSFVAFLDDVDSDAIKTMFEFLRIVRPSPELAQEEEDRLALIEAQDIAGKRLVKWMKQKLFVRSVRHFFKHLIEHYKNKENKKSRKEKDKNKEELVKYGIKLAPKLIEGSDPPKYDSPDPKWLERMSMVHQHIRAMVDKIGFAFPDSIRSFSVGVDAQNLLYEPFTIVGINALFISKEDKTNKHLLEAKLKSWLPYPWRASIYEYCIVLHDILVGHFQPEIRDKIDIMVAAYCKGIKKKRDREWFEMIIQNIRNKKEDPLTFPEEDPEQQMEEDPEKQAEQEESEPPNYEELAEAAGILTNMK